jgi:hypothetical protein
VRESDNEGHGVPASMVHGPHLVLSRQLSMPTENYSTSVDARLAAPGQAACANRHIKWTRQPDEKTPGGVT